MSCMQLVFGNRLCIGFKIENRFAFWKDKVIDHIIDKKPWKIMHCHDILCAYYWFTLRNQHSIVNDKIWLFF